MARGIGRRTHRIPPQKTQRLALLLQKLHARTIFVGEEPPQKTQRLALLLHELHARTILDVYKRQRFVGEITGSPLEEAPEE